jgi:putative membrane protein
MSGAGKVTQASSLRLAGFASWILALLFSSNAGAHEISERAGGPQNWNELARVWSFEPAITILLALSLWLYVRGTLRLWHVTQPGRGIRATEFCCYCCGWLTLFVALVSPLHPWGSVLFSAHMTQHELLMLVAAPALVLGRPIIAFLWALPAGWAPRLNRMTSVRSWRVLWAFITNPFVAWLIHAVVLWAWHAPALFQATLESDFVHALQHVSFLSSALLFWWAIIQGRQRVLGYGLAVLYLFTTALHSGLLGALLTFSRAIWYPIYGETTAAWGLTPLEDQQLGGLIMWIPAGLAYIIAGLALFAGWLRESEMRAAKRELAQRTDVALRQTEGGQQ